MTMEPGSNINIYKKRIFIIGIVIIFLLTLLLVRLWYLQVTKEDYYRRQAERNRLRIIRTPAPRGLIFDRKGKVLVDNKGAFSLILKREFVKNEDKILKLAGERFNLSNDEIIEKLKRYNKISPLIPIILKPRLSFKEIAFVEAHKDVYPELGIEWVPSRHYIYGTIAAHLIGYVGETTLEDIKNRTLGKNIVPGDIVGKTGIERQYNAALMGTKGEKRVFVNSVGQVTGILSEKPPERGKDLYLTIDLSLQQVASELMKKYKGALVALNPSTGGIYCMVSTPTFDPNIFTGHISIDLWRHIVNDPDKPLQNKVIQGLYAPGSIFKILVALAALNEGKCSPDTTFFCAGETTLVGQTVHCWKQGGHGKVKLISAITNSCNIYFYNLGLRLGVDLIHKWAQIMGLGRRTGIDLPGEAKGLVPSTEWKRRVYGQKWYSGETISVAIGQGAVSVTPIQVAYFMANVALNRKTPPPHLLLKKGINHIEGEKPLMDEKVHKIILQGMEDVVEKGTGVRARVPGIRVAGKTGTAQLINTKTAEKMKNYKKEYRENSWFACFAPVENPKIALAIVVEHGGHGGSVAAPIAGSLLKAFFKIRPAFEKNGDKNGE